MNAEIDTIKGEHAQAISKAYLNNYLKSEKNTSNHLDQSQPDIKQIIKLGDRNNYEDENSGELLSNRLDFDEF